MTYSMHLFLESLSSSFSSIIYSIPETIVFAWGILQMRFSKNKLKPVLAVLVILLDVVLQAYWNSVGIVKAKLFFMDNGPEWSYRVCADVVIIATDIIRYVGILLLFEEKLIKGFVKIFFCDVSVGIFTGTIAEFVIDKVSGALGVTPVSGLTTVFGIVMMLCVAYFMKKQKALVRCINDIPMMYYIVCIAFYMLLMEIPMVMADFARSVGGGVPLGDSLDLILFGYDIMRIMYTLLAVLIFMNMWRGQYKRESALKDSYFKVSEDYRDSMMRHMKEVRSIRHDLSAHISALESCLESGDTERAKEYLATLKEQQKFGSARLVNVGNELVSAVLSDIMRKSDEDILLECEGVLPSKLPIDDFDLCAIFSNIVTNSVEACSRLTDK